MIILFRLMACIVMAVSALELAVLLGGGPSMSRSQQEFVAATVIGWTIIGLVLSVNRRR